MKKRIYLLMLALFLIVSFSNNVLPQEKQNNNTERIKQRAESLLQTIREERWDELYKFVVVFTGKNDSQTRQRMKISENADENEIKQKIGDWFKSLYGKTKPGEIIRPVRIDPKDKTLAYIGYKHGDLDAFAMRLIDGEWYYTQDY